MKEFISQYWWAVWGVLVTVTLVWYRVSKRGGNEPLFRKVLYSAFPETDPSNRHRRISSKVFIFAVVGILFAVVANILLIFLNR